MKMIEINTKLKRHLKEIDGLNLYWYTAVCHDVYDGDTITVQVDLGFDIWRKMKIRLHGIDTPEIRGEEREDGLVSKEYVESKILNTYILIRTHKDRTGKYGRYLADIFYWDDDLGQLINLNAELVAKGFAEPYE